MGQKVHPKIFRTGVIYAWNSRWFSDRDFAKMLREDVKIRDFLGKRLKDCGVDHVEIERTARALTITIHSAKPGFIIGRGGTGIEDLKKELRVKLGKAKDKLQLHLNVVEVSQPSLSAHVIMQSMIADLEKRMPFRRVLRFHLDRIQKAGAKGVRLMVKGRLNGAEIAREEKVSWGSVPLHNLRADIDFASGFARTIFGAIGVKVWINRGEIFGKERKSQTVAAPPRRRSSGRPPRRHA